MALRRLPSLREAPLALLADAQQQQPRSPRRIGANGFAADAAAPLLGAEEARSDGEQGDDVAAVGTNGRHVSSVVADADGPPSPAAEEAAAAAHDRVRELRLYKLVRLSCLHAAVCQAFSDSCLFTICSLCESLYS